jgi:hypothetical protein
MCKADYVSLEFSSQMAIVMEKLCLNSFGWIIPGGGIKIFKMMQK